MKKRYMAALLTLGLMLTGCNGEENNSNSSELISSQPEDTDVTSATESSPEKTRGTIVITTPIETPEESSSPEESTPQETVEQTDAFKIYAELITGFDNAYLGLPKMDTIYVFEASDKTAEIGGAVYHCVSCYDEYEGERYYMCDFYISEDGAAVYRYYESTGEFILLPEESGYPSFDPAVQSPEEIFRYSERLYTLFFGRCDDMVDWSSPVDMGDGKTYYPVVDEQLDTMNELLEAMNKYFSNELMNSYMETGYVIPSPDGGLLRATGHEPVYPEVCGDVQFELTSLTESTAVFASKTPSAPEDDGMGSVTIDGESVQPEYAEHTFTAELQYGVWRFTSYENVYSR